MMRVLFLLAVAQNKLKNGKNSLNSRGGRYLSKSLQIFGEQPNRYIKAKLASALPASKILALQARVNPSSNVFSAHPYSQQAPFFHFVVFVNRIRPTIILKGPDNTFYSKSNFTHHTMKFYYFYLRNTYSFNVKCNYRSTLCISFMVRFCLVRVVS